MKLYSPDITKPTEVNYYWHEKVLIEPMPKPKQGEWIEHERAEEVESLLISNYECSECHSWERSTSSYCPNCGAKMKGADDE